MNRYRFCVHPMTREIWTFKDGELIKIMFEMPVKAFDKLYMFIRKNAEYQPLGRNSSKVYIMDK